MYQLLRGDLFPGTLLILVELVASATTNTACVSQLLQAEPNSAFLYVSIMHPCFYPRVTDIER